VDHPTSGRGAAEILRRLLQLFPNDDDALVTGRSTEDPESVLSPHLVANLERSHSIPRPHHLLALSQRFHLTLGASFRIFGFDLDRLPGLDHHLNGERTRFVESYSFDRDRLVDLPAALGPIEAFRRTAFRSELVPSWQEAIPIRSVAGRNWLRQATVYARIGAKDGAGLPRVPPGSFVAIAPLSPEERLAPDRESVYFLQHGSGYLATSCAVQDGRLFLITRNGNYAGRYDFPYPQEIRIVGRISGLCAGLPIRTTQAPIPARQGERAPLILPWEHNSLPSLIKAERVRFGVTEAQVRRAADYLHSTFHISVSARTLRRYEHPGRNHPNTGVLLGMTLLNSLRFKDVIMAANLRLRDAQSYSLDTLLQANTQEELPVLPGRAPAPAPIDRWQLMLHEWHEWPALLSMTFPNPRKLGYQILRIHQSSIFRGLDPLIRPGSLVLLDESAKQPNTQDHRELRDWERPVYALQHNTDILCGYLDNDGTHIALVPHPEAGSVPRISFLKHQVQLLGMVIGVASRFEAPLARS
jgi:hypothetical protein